MKVAIFGAFANSVMFMATNGVFRENNDLLIPVFIGFLATVILLFLFSYFFDKKDSEISKST